MMHNASNQTSPVSNSSGQAVGAWYWIVRWIFGFFIVTGNSFLVIIILVRRRLRHATPNLFISSLAVADFCVGAFIVPGSYICSFHATCDWSILMMFFNFLLFTSISNLCVMTLDRFIAVVFPYRYAQFMTTRKAWVFTAFAWIIPMTICSIRMGWESENDHVKASFEKIYQPLVLVSIEITPCVLMVATHVPIYLIVRKHARQIASQRVQVDRARPTLSRKNERSTVKVFMVVVFLFILCYFFSIYRVVCSYFSLCKPPVEVKYFSRLLLLANSGMNPFVYSFMKRDIRREAKNFLTGCLGRFGCMVNLRNDVESSLGSTNNTGNKKEQLSVM